MKTKCEGCGQVHEVGEACHVPREAKATNELNNLDNYVELATRTEHRPSPNTMEEYFQSSSVIRILHAALGLQTEVGEFTDQLKRHLFYGAGLDEVNLLEELGDIFWYCAIAADALGLSFEEIQRKNINKLRKRFPNMFKETDALHRNLDAEREALLTALPEKL